MAIGVDQIYLSMTDPDTERDLKICRFGNGHVA